MELTIAWQPELPRVEIRKPAKRPKLRKLRSDEGEVYWVVIPASSQSKPSATKSDTPEGPKRLRSEEPRTPKSFGFFTYAKRNRRPTRKVIDWDAYMEELDRESQIARKKTKARLGRSATEDTRISTEHHRVDSPISTGEQNGGRDAENAEDEAGRRSTVTGRHGGRKLKRCSFWRTSGAPPST